MAGNIFKSLDLYEIGLFLVERLALLFLLFSPKSIWVFLLIFLINLVCFVSVSIYGPECVPDPECKGIYWVERFAFFLLTVLPRHYMAVWARRIAACLFVLSNLFYAKDLIEYLMESQEFLIFGSTNNPTEEPSKEEELIEGEAKMENDLHTENKDDNRNDRSEMKEDQAAVGHEITSKLSKLLFRMVAVLILLMASDYLNWRSMIFLYLAYVHYTLSFPIENHYVVHCHDGISIAFLGIPFISGSLLFWRVAYGLYTLSSMVCLFYLTRNSRVREVQMIVGHAIRFFNSRVRKLLMIVGLATRFFSSNSKESDKSEEPLEGQTTKQDEQTQGDQEASAEGEANNKMEEELLGSKNCLDFKMLEREADDRYEEEFLLAYFLDDSSETSNNSLTSESESDRHGNPIDRYEDDFLLPYFLDNSSDTSNNSLATESESDRHGNPIDRYGDEFSLAYIFDFLDNNSDISNNSCRSGNFRQRLFKREIKDEGFEHIQVHHALMEKLNQLEHDNYTLAAKVDAYEENRLNWEVQKHEQFKLMEEKNMISVKLDEAIKSLEKYQGIANEFEVQRSKWEEERNELNAKLTNINCWYYHYVQLANNYDVQNRILFEERNTASAKLVVANESSESYKSRLLESEQVCDRLKVKVNVEASSAEYFSKLLHECEEKCRVLEEEKNELAVKLCTATASSELYQSLLRNLDIQ